MSDPIDELKILDQGGYCVHLGYRAILALAYRLAALERTVKDYKEAVDMVTAWADERDRQAYEKAIKEIPDEPDYCTCDHETDTWFDRSYTINAKGEWEGPYERCCECGKEKKAIPDDEWDGCPDTDPQSCPSCGWPLDEDGNCANEECKPKDADVVGKYRDKILKIISENMVIKIPMPIDHVDLGSILADLIAEVTK